MVLIFRKLFEKFLGVSIFVCGGNFLGSGDRDVTPTPLKGGVPLGGWVGGDTIITGEWTFHVILLSGQMERIIFEPFSISPKS